MSSVLSSRLEIQRFMRPDHRAEAAALTVMASAFDPAFGEAWTGAQLSGFMSLPGVRLSLARIDRACLGFSLVRHVADEAELLLIGVDRKWQNKGIGGTLLRDFISQARKSQIVTLYLEVRDNNPAIDFYLRYGFENIHRRPNYYKGPNGTCHDALSFRLAIS